MVFYLCTLFSYCVYNIGALTSLILYNIVFLSYLCIYLSLDCFLFYYYRNVLQNNI